jgi:hypothetical protein
MSRRSPITTGEAIYYVFIATITILVAGFMVYGFMWFGDVTTVKWHDLGTVTQYQNNDLLVWEESYGQYQHKTWTTANVTTISHGILHFDSRDSCPTGAVLEGISCASMEVSGWHLNQTLGIVYKNGGWYEVQDP